MDVEVVVAVLLHPAQRGQLGQDVRVRPSVVISSSPSRTRSAATTRLSSANTRSAATASIRGAAPRGRVDGLGVGGERQLGGEAREAQDAQRVVVERARRDHPQALRRQVARAAVGVDDASPPTGRAIALTVKSRRARSSSSVAPCSGARSTCQARPGPMTRHAPNSPDSSNAGPPAARPAPWPRRARRRQRDVDVGHRAPEQLVAHRAADDPGALAAQRRRRRRRAPRRREPLTPPRPRRRRDGAGAARARSTRW